MSVANLAVRRSLRNVAMFACLAVVTMFSACNKDEGDGKSNGKLQSVQEYNGFLYRDYRKNGTSLDWAYATVKITVKEFDTYLEVHVGDKSVKSEKIERGDNGKINKATFKQVWNYGNPVPGQLGLNHSDGEACFYIEEASYGSGGGTVTRITQILLTPDVEWCRTKHFKTAYNQPMVISTKTSISILDIL